MECNSLKFSMGVATVSGYILVLIEQANQYKELRVTSFCWLVCKMWKMCGTEGTFPQIWSHMTKYIYMCVTEICGKVPFPHILHTSYQNGVTLKSLY